MQEGRAEDATWSTEEQRAVEKVLRNVEERFDLTLWGACFYGFPKAVEAALEVEWIKRDPNRATEEGGTPLYVACQIGHLDVVRMLLSTEGIEPNRAEEEDGSTPLYIACEKGHLDVVRMLLSTEGIDPDRAEENGATPLFIACQMGHLDVVRMLLSVDGIDPNRANANKQTPVNLSLIHI